MRLTLLLFLVSLLFLCGVASGYYTVTPDKTFFVGDTTYCFNQTMNLTKLGKNGSWFIADDLQMMAFTMNNTGLLVRIDKMNGTMMEFMYHANKTCEVFFNCSGVAFTKMYLGGNETVQVALPASSSMMGEFLDVYKDDKIIDMFLQLMPLVMIIFVFFMILSFLRPII